MTFLEKDLKRHQVHVPIKTNIVIQKNIKIKNNFK